MKNNIIKKILIILVIIIFGCLAYFFDKNLNTVNNISYEEFYNSRLINIPKEIYENTKEEDYFFDILNSDKIYVYVMYSKNSEYSTKFLETVSNAVNQKPLNSYYTLKSQAIEDRTEPQVSGKPYNVNVWFLENCGSFCVIDNKHKRIITPDISTENEDPNNRGKAMNFLNDVMKY